MQDKNINQASEQMSLKNTEEYKPLIQKSCNLNGTIYDMQGLINAALKKNPAISNPKIPVSGFVIVSFLGIWPSSKATATDIIFMINYRIGNIAETAFIPYKDFIKLNILPYFPRRS